MDRWQDRRTDRVCGGVGGGGHRYLQALLHRRLLQQEGRGCQKMNNRRITSNSPMWGKREREETFGQNCIAQTKLEVRQSVGRTRTGGQVFSRHTKNTDTEREREARVFTALLQTHQWGCWIRDCVETKKTQPQTLCRAKKPHAPWFSASSETKVNHLTHVHTHTHIHTSNAHQHCPATGTHRWTERGVGMERWKEDVIWEEV